MRKETVKVVPSYDLSSIVQTGVEGGKPKERGGINQPGRYDDCNEGGDTCINFPTLIVTVTK